MNVSQGRKRADIFEAHSNLLLLLLLNYLSTRYYLNGGDAFRLKLWIDKVPEHNIDTSS